MLQLKLFAKPGRCALAFPSYFLGGGRILSSAAVNGHKNSSFFIPVVLFAEVCWSFLKELFSLMYYIKAVSKP